MPDLLIKERNPDGTLGELKPAFPGGETQAQKISNLQESLDVAILELTMAIAMAGIGGDK